MWTFVIGAFVALGLLTTAAGLGHNYAARKCNAAALMAQIEQLQQQLSAAKLAAQADAEVLEASRPETERLEGASRELADQISDGICFPESDVGSLRKLWGTVTVRPTR